jgi:FKBP-type peptidyl-prolyl cis-trans isomerase FklB
MKKYFLFGFSILTLVANAQKATTKKTTTVKQHVAANPLKNLKDSVSYAIGSMVANFYKQQGIKSLNSSIVAKAVSDVYTNKKILLSEAQANACLMSYLSPDLTKTVQAGEKFLAGNKNKPGVKTTASGLQYEVLREGKGAKPEPRDTVTVNYAGTLLDGTEFDNSYKRGEPISFPLGGVIQGWIEALQLMTVGSKFKLYIPQQLGYGMNGSGAVPGGALLVFEVELLAINGKQ